MGSSGVAGWVVTARGLYLVSMAVFLVTLAIGIPNGLDVVDVPRDILLAHVHSGTLGWISLGVVATAAWLFAGLDRRLAIGLAILVPLYVAAFASGNPPARAIGGVALLVAILLLIGWIWQAYLGSARTVPQLAVALGLTTFTYGAVIGVLLQVQFATGAAWLSGDAIGSHAGAMVFAYLVLVAMGILEWRLRGTAGRPASGIVQVGALFVGGLVLSGGLLLGVAQVAGGIYLLVTLVAIVLFAVRVAPAALRSDWLAAGPGRHLGAAALWVIVAVAIYLYLVGQFLASGGDASSINTGILVASDHATFVGVMTNTLFGLIWTIAPPAGPAWRWPAHAVFWGMNAGLAIFVVGLAAAAPVLKEIGAPVMGVCILLGLAMLAIGLWRGLRDPLPVELQAPAPSAASAPAGAGSTAAAPASAPGR